MHATRITHHNKQSIYMGCGFHSHCTIAADVHTAKRWLFLSLFADGISSAQSVWC